MSRAVLQDMTNFPDIDWFAAELTDGETSVMEVLGAGATGCTLLDPILDRLYDGSGAPASAVGSSDADADDDDDEQRAERSASQDEEADKNKGSNPDRVARTDSNNDFPATTATHGGVAADGTTAAGNLTAGDGGDDPYPPYSYTHVFNRGCHAQDMDCFKVALSASRTYTVTMEGKFSRFVQVYKSRTERLAPATDSQPTETDSLTLRPEEDGDYYFVVGEHHQSRYRSGSYTLRTTSTAH